MKYLDKFNHLIASGFAFMMVISMAVMVVMVFGNVVLRYVFNSGIAISEELSRWLFLWIIFMGATIAVKERSHMGTDLLLRKLPPFLQRLLLMVGHLLMIYVTWLMLDGTWQLYLLNVDVLSPVTEWSQGWVFASALLFAGITLWLFTIDLIKILNGQLNIDSVHGLPNSNNNDEESS